MGLSASDHCSSFWGFSFRILKIELAWLKQQKNYNGDYRNYKIKGIEEIAQVA